MRTLISNSTIPEFPARKAALFVVERLSQNFGVQWLGGPRAHLEPIIEVRECVLDLLLERNVSLSLKAQQKVADCRALSQVIENYYLRSVRDDSQRALIEWLRGHYPIVLIHFIPTPEEMLEIQCVGLRFVTMLEGREDQNRKIGRHQGALEFLLHDLEHADKFFSDARSFFGQKKFFNCIHRSLKSEKFRFLNEEEIFKKDFHYVMADMNSHPVHLFKYLKAIVLMNYLRRADLGGSENLPSNLQTELDDFWFDLLHDWGMSDEQVQGGIRMNRPQLEQPEDVLKIDSFFSEGFYVQ